MDQWRLARRRRPTIGPPLVSLLVLVIPTLLRAQVTPRPVVAPVLRLEGGMLNPDDPFQVTMAAGGAIGIRVRRFDLLLRGLYQAKNGYSDADLEAEGRTFWGIAAEYAVTVSQADRREGLLQFGAGRLHRPHFRTSWFMELGLAGRHRIAPPVALIVSVQDLLVFLPGEEAGCEPIPRGRFCTAAVTEQAQHNLGVVLAVEVIP